MVDERGAFDVENRGPDAVRDKDRGKDKAGDEPKGPTGAERVRAAMAEVKKAEKQTSPQDKAAAAKQIKSTANNCSECWDDGRDSAVDALQRGQAVETVRNLEPASDHRRHDMVAWRMGRNAAIDAMTSEPA